MTKEKTTKEIIKNIFGVDLPISGGGGCSTDDAIKINKEYLDWSGVEHSCLKYLNALQNRNWKMVKQSTIEKNGRIFDQMKLEIEGDNANYFNYYFDVTDHMNNQSLFITVNGRRKQI